MAKRQVRTNRVGRLDKVGSVKAKGLTFAQATFRGGTSLISPRASGPLGPNMAPKFGAFDTLAQAWVAKALAVPNIASRVRQTHASGAELVVAGYFLSLGYVEGRDLFFQEYKFVIDDRTRRSHRLFVVDDAINSKDGGTIFLNIDGVEYHKKTELEMFKDGIRDGRLRAKGKVVDVPDTACYTGEDLKAFFLREGVP